MTTPKLCNTRQPAPATTAIELDEPGDGTLRELREFEALLAADPDYPRCVQRSIESDYDAWLDSLGDASNFDDPSDTDLINGYGF